MSWDLLAGRFPEEYEKVEDLPDNFKLEVIGTRDEVVALMQKAVPEVGFDQSGWGGLDGATEVYIGDEPYVDSISFFVHGGGQETVMRIFKVASSLNLRVIDYSSGEFIELDGKAVENYKQWERYKDYVLQSSPPKE
jgi:hypothetical protein